MPLHKKTTVQTFLIFIVVSSLLIKLYNVQYLMSTLFQAGLLLLDVHKVALPCNFLSYTGQFWWEGSLRVLALKVLFVRLGVWHLRLLKIKPVKVRMTTQPTIQVNGKVSSQPVLK